VEFHLLWWYGVPESRWTPWPTRVKWPSRLFRSQQTALAGSLVGQGVVPGAVAAGALSAARIAVISTVETVEDLSGAAVERLVARIEPGKALVAAEVFSLICALAALTAIWAGAPAFPVFPAFVLVTSVAPLVLDLADELHAGDIAQRDPRVRRGRRRVGRLRDRLERGRGVAGAGRPLAARRRERPRTGQPPAVNAQRPVQCDRRLLPGHLGRLRPGESERVAGGGPPGLVRRARRDRPRRDGTRDLGGGRPPAAVCDDRRHRHGPGDGAAGRVLRRGAGAGRRVGPLGTGRAQRSARTGRTESSSTAVVAGRSTARRTVAATSRGSMCSSAS